MNKELVNISDNTRRITNVSMGKNVKIYDFVNIYGCSIGNNTKIGTFVEIQKGVKIGSSVKIQSHSFICEGVTIEDNVFIGHGVNFINDRYPRAVNKEGELQKECDWVLESTIVKKGASIGTGSIILCGIEIGEDSIVGAGSIVTKSIPARVVVAGNPARILRGI